MILIGNLLVVFSFIFLFVAIVASIASLKRNSGTWKEVSVRAIHCVTLSIIAASVILIWALIRSDFSFEYVASYTSTTLPLIYKITAFWAGQAGSLLFWLLILMVYTSISLILYRHKYREVIPWFIIFTGGSALFFNLLILLFTNPFAPMDVVVSEGRGLNPLLQNIGMIFHPPTLYFGYVGFTIPFAFAMAALLSRSYSVEWLKITRKWTLISWAFLTIGIILGAQWAYVELGWGGYWAWDPVENASFIPWLAATAFLHTVILQQRRGMLKKWNVFLITATFLLCVFGTFITRSGFIESVHAFGQSKIGYYFLFFIFTVLIVSIIVIYLRRNLLKKEITLKEFSSKEGVFIINNTALMAFMLIVLIGTIYPTLSEFLFSRKSSIKAPFFNHASVPFGIVLLVLIGVCQIVGWRKAKKIVHSYAIFGVITAVVAFLFFVFVSSEIIPDILFALTISAFINLVFDFVRSIFIRKKLTGEIFPDALIGLISKSKRRFGAFIVHIGVIFLCVGIIGSAYFSESYDQTASPGATFTAGKYHVTYKKFKGYSTAEKDVLQAVLEISNGGKRVTTLKPEKHFHKLFEQPITEVAIYMTPLHDLYVIFSPLNLKGKASFKILINPLVFWLWLGGAFMAIGSFIAILPNRRKSVQKEIQGELGL